MIRTNCIPIIPMRPGSGSRTIENFTSHYARNPAQCGGGADEPRRLRARSHGIKRLMWRAHIGNSCIRVDFAPRRHYSAEADAAAGIPERKVICDGKKGCAMDRPARVVHYLNQFFGGLGGEEHAYAPVQVKEGPVGPGRALQTLLDDRGSVVATIIAGDNAFTEELDASKAAVEEILAQLRPEVVIAGPA